MQTGNQTLSGNVKKVRAGMKFLSLSAKEHNYGVRIRQEYRYRETSGPRVEGIVQMEFHVQAHHHLLNSSSHLLHQQPWEQENAGILVAHAGRCRIQSTMTDYSKDQLT